MERRERTNLQKIEGKNVGEGEREKKCIENRKEKCGERRGKKLVRGGRGLKMDTDWKDRTLV